MKTRYYLMIALCMITPLALAGCAKHSGNSASTTGNLITCKRYCDKSRQGNARAQCYNDCSEATTPQKQNDTKVLTSPVAASPQKELTQEGCKDICIMTYGKAGSITGEQECLQECGNAKDLKADPLDECSASQKSGSILTTGLCIQEKAVEAENPAYCDQINSADEKDICYLELSRSTVDLSLCDKIHDAETKRYCDNRKR